MNFTFHSRPKYLSSPADIPATKSNLILIFDYLYTVLRSLKILQVTNRIPWPLNDGGNLATYHVAKHLGDIGHEIVLAALNTQKHHQDPEVLKGVAKVYSVDIDTSIGLIPLIKSLFGQLPYNIERFVSPEFSYLLKEVIAKHEPDVVQLEGSYQAIFIQAIRSVTEAPIVLRSHNVEWRIWKRLCDNEKNLIKKGYLRHLYKKIRKFEMQTLAQFDGVIAITEEDQAWYAEQFSGKVLRTINAGVDLENCQAGDDWPPNSKIGFIGSLEWQPNVEGLLWFVRNVWPQVYQKYPETELHIAGKNPPEWMGSWEVPGMKFHGMVPSAHAFMEEVHVFIVPLLSGSGMRLKVVEALAMRKCVISTPIGAEGIELEDGRDILLEETPEGFANSICQVLENPEKGRRIAENGLETARLKYDWRNLIHKFVEVYEDIL